MSARFINRVIDFHIIRVYRQSYKCIYHESISLLERSSVLTLLLVGSLTSFDDILYRSNVLLRVRDLHFNNVLLKASDLTYTSCYLAYVIKVFFLRCHAHTLYLALYSPLTVRFFYNRACLSRSAIITTIETDSVYYRYIRSNIMKRGSI